MFLTDQIFHSQAIFTEILGVRHNWIWKKIEYEKRFVFRHGKSIRTYPARNVGGSVSGVPCWRQPDAGGHVIVFWL